jgi:drug/metabolite transporter (DMT)-like permease
VATFAGILLVVLGSHARAGTEAGSITGDLIMFGASIAWAFYTVGSRPLIDRYGAVAVTAWTLWIGAAGLVLAGLPAVLNTDFARVSAWSWSAVIYAGVFSIGVAYIIWYYGVKQLGNTRTAAYSNVTPVIALAVAWLWLGETPSAAQLLGAAVIVGGVSVAQSGG